MELEWRVAVLVLALATGALAWLLLQRGRGELRTDAHAATLPAMLAGRAGSRLTLVQVSSEHCTACVRGARVWRAAITDRDDVGFVEIDAAEHMDLVRNLGVMTTPTTLVYDERGTLRGRVTGAPTPKAAVAALVPEPDGALR